MQLTTDTPVEAGCQPQLVPAQDAGTATSTASAALLALAYPPDTSHPGWLVSGLDTATGDIVFRFDTGTTEWDNLTAERGLRRHGYVSLAGLLHEGWTPLPDTGHSTHLLPAVPPGDHDRWSAGDGLGVLVQGVQERAPVVGRLAVGMGPRLLARPGAGPERGVVAGPGAVGDADGVPPAAR
ncbi:hypothetical protein ACGF13_35020 [Kitasatospora sp. NPDC048286]|uniref:hypothetical protein n=1 Tax=Kitasatospora sp. NPDC048286 TaxID=3364047 RepID=UPI0037201A5B